jgi:hypothetical protein
MPLPKAAVVPVDINVCIVRGADLNQPNVSHSQLPPISLSIGQSDQTYEP